MIYWPVGDYYDNTTRLIGEWSAGFESEESAQAVIDKLLRKQSKPHHVVYRVESANSLEALQSTGVLV